MVVSQRDVPPPASAECNGMSSGSIKQPFTQIVSPASLCFATFIPNFLHHLAQIYAYTPNTKNTITNSKYIIPNSGKENSLFPKLGVYGAFGLWTPRTHGAHRKEDINNLQKLDDALVK